MNQPLRILHLEDDPADCLLVRDQLVHDGLAVEIRNVVLRADFIKALAEANWDLVLADYRLPDFTGLDALKLVREKFPALPFILISGIIGEQAAIESLKAGATDYVLKQKRDRLPSAVRRAIAEAGAHARREAAEEDLRRSEKQYRRLFESNPHPMWVFDLENRQILEVNEAAILHYGYSREEFLAMTLADLRAPEHDKDSVWDAKAQGLVWSHRRKDGQVMDMEVNWSTLVFHGRLAALTMVTDVTARRAAESALRSSENLFRSVWENSVDGMRLTDEHGSIVAANDAFGRLVGLTSEQLEGKPFTVVYSAGMDWEKLSRSHHEHFQAGSLPGRREREYTLHDGRMVRFEIMDSYVVSGGKPRLRLSLFRDVTAQKRLEEQLRQSQKMEAIGQLAGGIAHDFNNILTIILGHATLLTMATLDSKALVSAKQIKQASERAAGLTRQLLAFGRKQIYNPRPLDLNRVVGKMSDMLGRLLGEDITLQLNFNSEPAVIEADASMMEQILLNLSVNSRDAMPRGGQLSIRISQREFDASQARQSVEARPGKFICLNAADSGGGIPPENLSRIFEPFFTTKELGKGTGLGLATVYGIVKQHHGWIEVESVLNQGTAFQIYFPVSELPIVEPEQFDTQFRARGGTETVLVVEDERDLREIVTRTLNRYGYRVFQAVNGQNALQIWADYKNEIDLVFTDVIMPGGMNGRELAEKLWTEKPRLKVIFSTGYGADALGQDFKLDPQLNFLQKPYLPQTLALIIRRCLDGERAL